MAKKKKKDKEKSKVESKKDKEKSKVESKKDKEKSKVESSTLDLNNVLKSSKKTQSTLHNLLKVVTEEKSFISPIEKEEKIAPQLSYEKKKEIANDYVMEQVPISERAPLKKRTPVSDISEEGKSSDLTEEGKSTAISEEGKSSDVSEEGKSTAISEEGKSSDVSEEGKSSDVSEEGKSPENADAQTISTTKTPSFSKEQHIYEKLTVFFEQVFDGYVDRYNQWENSISTILSILRKMRKITKKNTEELVSSVSGLFEKIDYNLDQFKLKRDQVEKITDVDVKSMSGEFKKVLGLLELQVKEYQLKKLSDEYVHKLQSF